MKMAGLFSNFSDCTNEEDKTQYCRTCGQNTDDMVPIFEEEGLDRQLAEKINGCLPILVSESDWLPLQVCLRCVLWLETAEQLRTSCLSADTKLRGIFPEPPGHEMPIDNDCLEDDSSSHYAEADYGSDYEQTDRPSSSQNSKEPETKVEKFSGALQFLAAEFGVNDPGLLMVVNKEPPHVDSLHLRMPAVKGIEPPPLYCDHCQEEFKSPHLLRRHFLKWHRLDMVHCRECFVYFSTYDKFKEHIEALHPQYKFPKLFGPKPRPQKNWKKRRVVSIYVGRRSSKKTCQRCKEVFEADEMEAWKNHWKKHRKDMHDEKLREANIKCDYCDKLFLTDNSKKCHMEFNHKQYKRYECDVCQKKFRIKAFYEAHILSHTSRPSFLCNVCGKCFFSKTTLSQHLVRHAAKFVCQICDLAVVKIRRVAHLRSHLDKRIFQCMECGQSFFDRESLKEHSASHFVTVCQCDICGFCFSSEHNLTIHQGYHKDPTTSLYKCPVKACTRQFITVGETASHFHSHSREEKFTMVRVSSQKDRQCNFFCFYCDMAFRHMGVYLDHMAAHQIDQQEPPELACAICKVVVNDAAALTSHLEAHPQALDFPCRHCKENFVTDKKREIHENIKHGGKVLCTKCNLTFRNNEHLKQHNNAAHTGLRPYICKICDRGFFSSKNLSKHKLVHGNEKKFACEECGRAFRIKSDLHKHVLRHTNEKMYNCSKCSYSTDKKRDIDLHIAMEHAQMCDEHSD